MIRKSRSNSRNVYENIEKPYEDEDGTATQISAKAFSAALPLYLVLCSTLLGLFLSGVTAIRSTLRMKAAAHVHPWLAFGSWAVDKQFSVPILSRWTFTWADELLTFAKKNHGLDMAHLPRLHLRVRSGYLEKSFNTKKQSNLLWKDLLRAHRLELARQSLFSVSQGVIQFTPQLAMYKLLELLEQRSEGKAVAKEAWAWVFGLGMAIIVTAWLETQMHWIVWARMGTLVRSELSALIFSKSTRRKDVKGHQKARTEENTTLNGATEVVPSGLTGQQQNQSGAPIPQPLNAEADEETQKSRQSVINLVAIDTKRISEFATCHWIFSQTAAKLCASVFFLAQLIGWPSLLAGFAFSALTLPVNIWAARIYSKTQTGLMKARDQKMVVVTEALQGIRQIKFSAVESQWEAKIGKQRAEELFMQWRSFAADTVLIGMWILGPVMLSAVSLAVFAFFEGGLSPSIAFTTITIFAQIEMALAVIPELTSDGLEAWVSLQRIGEYLQAPEKEEYSIPSETVAFEAASVAWPSDTQGEDPARFVLKNINIQFPPQELSVITGKTGSGKSLLLAAILGEADRIDGIVKVPRAPTQRHDHIANRSNWVIDTAIAFVAQIPWIENATIKDNILFGLPFDKQRYDKVISSAVDAHVGRQLFEEALVGELGKGRTRILVTHHLALCLSGAAYVVSLDNGTVEYAARVKELQQRGILEQPRNEPENVPGTLPNSAREGEGQKAKLGNNADHLRKIISTKTDHSVNTDGSEVDIKGKGQPKKFTEEEKREKGSVKFSIWKEVVDSRMGTDVGFMLYQVIQLLGIIVAGLFVSPYMLLSALGLLIVCLFVGLRFLAGAREVKRLESNAKSPIFEQFGSALAGIGTIRAFAKADDYIDRPHILSYYMLRKEAMNAMERIVEYSRIPIEDQQGAAVPATWPAEGRLEVKGLVAGYAPDLPPVLKGLSFSVARNQRVGVVGRTGAGKSSLTLALFRFLEAREGSIKIDGIDVSKISLHDLRSRLAIIPQDPVLFSGTVRSNLDAFEEHDDAELYDALERVHLIRRTGNVSRGDVSSAAGSDEFSCSAFSDTNTNVFSSLSSRISEGGLNLSQGQRQLLCLARAIVSRPKVMVLDEATSAVDMQTDVLIQRSIREEFDDSTLIVIAHRLSTISDFDRILVMSEGKAVEYDTPKNLMAQRGAFWEMVEQSGDRDRLEEIILGVNFGVREGRAR
ncbi:MAG: hypothetical protein Q9182_006150 [Xanthomendoza sp. 2 TL-2023]